MTELEHLRDDRDRLRESVHRIGEMSEDPDSLKMCRQAIRESESRERYFPLIKEVNV